MTHAIRYCWVIFALLISQPAAGKVTVLANRTVNSITIDIERVGQRAEQITIPSGDSQPIFFSHGLAVRFGEGFQRERFSLQPSNAYFFTRGPDGARLRLEQIGLGEQATPQPTPVVMPKSAGPTSFTTTITVKLLADENEPTHRRIWEPKLRQRIAAASDILERHSGIRLKVVEVATWDSDEQQRHFVQTLREFEQEVKPQPAQLAIGFSSQYNAEGGRSHLGVTRWPLHSHILLRERSRNLMESERLELLLHELGHYLGASHSPEPQSVMRPLLTRGLQRGVGSRITFDPVNALIIAMMGEEIRLHGVSNIRRLTEPTRERLKEIYGVLSIAMPRDPAARQYLRMMEFTAATKPATVKRSRSTTPIARETQKVLTHLVSFAEQQHQLAAGGNAADEAAVTGDELTNLYIRQAAQAALKLRSKSSPRAMLLALGIFVDDQVFLREFAGTADFLKQVESDEQREKRLQVLGKPTMRERTDLTKHFLVSATLCVAIGKPAAVAAGLAKETSDSQGGTGFSFVDMAANRAGIVFAERLLDEKLKLTQVAEGFHVDDYLPTLRGLQEGLTAEQLQNEFGGNDQPTIAEELEAIEDRVLSLPVYDQ